MTFILKQHNVNATLPMLHVVGVRPTKGSVGIEVEVEGNKFPKHEYEGHLSVDPDKIPDQWKYHRDGSLRGDDNAEYVLAKPITFNEVPKAVNDLWSMFADYGTVLDESNRTSVHVHLNVQDWYLNRLCSFMGLYFSVEELLTAWCGEHRVGNLFCLRAKDAPAIITELKTFFQCRGKHSFSNGMHYAGFNASSLHRFGSVEIRTLRGSTEPSEIITWVGILQRLYDLSEEYTDPRQVIEGFSGEGAMAYLERVLGPYTNTVLEGSRMSLQEAMGAIYNGIRYAQDLCYAIDWTELEYIDPNNDPFKRTPKKIAASFDMWAAATSVPQPIPYNPPEEDEPDEYEPDDDYYDEDD